MNYEVMLVGGPWPGPATVNMLSGRIRTAEGTYHRTGMATEGRPVFVWNAEFEADVPLLGDDGEADGPSPPTVTPFLTHKPLHRAGFFRGQMGVTESGGSPFRGDPPGPSPSESSPEPVSLETTSHDLLAHSELRRLIELYGPMAGLVFRLMQEAAERNAGRHSPPKPPVLELSREEAVLVKSALGELELKGMLFRDERELQEKLEDWIRENVEPRRTAG